eukprot:TRINITY_DN1956_c0_g1_i1.p1 TRINITY_DN1956_c0_g1~~TRINITY_DN1956_c0_g1_i1.p1  ORF type:complete len:593 (+),score=57.84 TRINITY_DN1956_c0_g1_i1:363-2141(+)
MADVENPSCQYQSLAGRHSNAGLGMYLLAQDVKAQGTLLLRKLLSSKGVHIIAGPVLTAFIIALTVMFNTQGPADQRSRSLKIGFMLAAVVWICFWWLTGAIPVAITSLIPLFLFPLLGIESADSVAKAYMNDTIALFIGSFILALAVEHHSVHKRLALKILLVFGGKNMDPHLLLLGFCVGPAFVSMWISNTAAAAMMVPMAIGVVERVRQCAPLTGSSSQSNEKQQQGELKGGSTGEESRPGDTDPLTLYSRGVVLAIAYAVAIGGMSTLTGTGSNLIFSGMWKSIFPELPPITYLQWFLFAFPICFTNLLLLWVLLTVWYCPESSSSMVRASLHRSVLEEEYRSLGPISFAEKAVVSCFSVLALLWITRAMGEYGWDDIFQGMAGDGTVSILIAMLLFMIPDCKVPGQKLMSWKLCKNLPWDIVLLLGGGFAMAEGIQISGLSQWVTDRLDFLQAIPYLLVAPVVALLVTLVTQVTSNNSAATIFLPLLAQVAVSINANPLLFMIPATLGSSFAYTMPVSTPPNAIAFSTGVLTMKDLNRTGLVLILVGLVLVGIAIPTLGEVVFGLSSPSTSLHLHPWTNSFPSTFAD